MVKSIKATDLLSRAEIGIIAAEEEFKDRNLAELNGQLLAVGKLIDLIRAESTEVVR